MEITKYKKVGKDKYKVFLDNDEYITLEESVILENNLLIKKELTEENYEKIIKDNNIATIYNDCLRLIGLRLRSVKEINEYLNKKQISDNIKDNIINKLQKYGYLNDEIFAKCFITDKINLTTSGPLKILTELKKHNISEDIIYKYLYNDINNSLFKEKINKIINKNIKSNKKYTGSILKNKLYYNLINNGYEKEMIIKQLNNHNFHNFDNLTKEYQKILNKYKNKYNEDKLYYVIKEKLKLKGYTSEDINNIIK